MKNTLFKELPTKEQIHVYVTLFEQGNDVSDIMNIVHSMPVVLRKHDATHYDLYSKDHNYTYELGNLHNLDYEDSDGDDIDNYDDDGDSDDSGEDPF